LENEIVIFLLGNSKSGKTSIINSLANYFL
jgi:hypothetical protein